jgi:hypothetical protein
MLVLTRKVNQTIVIGDNVEVVVLEVRGEQPMSDPKTSPNNSDASESVSFQDRLSVVGNASFICFVIAVAYTVLFLGKAQFNIGTLVLLSAPLISTGLTVLIGAVFKDLVPKSTLSAPINFTVPLIWCLCSYLAVMLISTQETGSTRVPEPLLPALAWAKVGTLLPVLICQVVVISILAVLSKDPS